MGSAVVDVQAISSYGRELSSCQSINYSLLAVFHNLRNLEARGSKKCSQPNQKRSYEREESHLSSKKEEAFHRTCRPLPTFLSSEVRFCMTSLSEVGISSG